MKILFIIKELTVFEPMGIMYLSSALMSRGHQTRLAVGNKDTFYEINNFHPDILAFSVMTGLHTYYLKLAKEIRSHKKIMTVFGGPHPTFFQEIIDEEYVDAICVGEGDISLPNFADSLFHGDIRRTKGFYIKSEGEIYKNDLEELISSFDKIPFPDREIIYEKSKYLRNGGIKTFMIGRGCPFNCSYCFQHAFRELYKNSKIDPRRVRLKSVDYVIKEIEDVRKNIGWIF